MWCACGRHATPHMTIIHAFRRAGCPLLDTRASKIPCNSSPSSSELNPSSIFSWEEKHTGRQWPDQQLGRSSTRLNPCTRMYPQEAEGSRSSKKRFLRLFRIPTCTRIQALSMRSKLLIRPLPACVLFLRKRCLKDSIHCSKARGYMGSWAL